MRLGQRFLFLRPPGIGKLRPRRWLTRSRCRHTPDCGIVIKYIFRPCWERHCSKGLVIRFLPLALRLLFLPFVRTHDKFSSCTILNLNIGQRKITGKLGVQWMHHYCPGSFSPQQHRECDCSTGEHWNSKRKTAMWARTSGPLRTGLWKQSDLSYYITSEGMLEHCRRRLLDDITHTHTHPEWEVGPLVSLTHRLKKKKSFAQTQKRAITLL